VRYCIPSLDQTGSPENETTDKNLKFPTREYPPDGLFEENLPYHLALLPLVLPDTLLGFVVFDTSNMGQYAAIARELAAAIKSTQLHAKILEMSQTDGLTNIYNRRFFEECFAKELERSRRYSRPLALIMIDLDHFKDYNDAFGHPAGDRALQEFAQVIRNEVRRNLDIVARYGGEEFVIVMPESTLDNALNLAERIRARLEASGALRSRLTTSIGVTACLAGRPDGDTLLSQADMALYKAKKSGRNRVCTYP